MGFDEQKQALQGLWSQTGKEQLQWFVEDDVATMVWKGSRRARSFKLKEGKDGELIWGSGKFVLDSAFSAGEKQAAWLSDKDRSNVAFSWDFASSEGPPQEEAMAPTVRRKGAGKGRGLKGKGKAVGKGKMPKGEGKTAGKGKGKMPQAPQQQFQRHIDPIDGMPYSYEEMLRHYRNSYSRMDILSYFLECSAERGKGRSAKGFGKGKAPTGKGEGKGAFKGKSYSKDQGKPGEGKGTGKAPSAERRTDPANGKSYTWEELRSFYASTWTKRQTEAYWWEQCHPDRGYKSAGKGKAQLSMWTKGKAWDY